MQYRTVRTLRRDARGELLLVERSEASTTDYFLLTRLPPDITHRPEAQQTFAGSLQQSMQLRHPNLTRVIAPTAPMTFVHEFMGGIDLATLQGALDKGGLLLPPDCALAIALEIAHALAYLHGYQDAEGRALQLVYGDLTPDRVWLGLHGEVKLAEMVSAATHRAGGHQPPWVQATLEHHFSPEALAGEPLDPRSDVYALGLLTWKLFANRVPRGRTIARLDHVLDRFPKPVADLVARALSEARDERFASALGFAEALSQAAESWAKPASAQTLAEWFSRYAMLQVADELPDKTLPGVAPPPPKLLNDSGTLETLVDHKPKTRWPWYAAAVVLVLGACTVAWFMRPAPVTPIVVVEALPEPSAPASQPASLPSPAVTPVVVQTKVALTGTVLVVSNTRATISIDGKKCASNAVRCDKVLSVGRHTVEVHAKNKKLAPYKAPVEVVGGQRAFVDVQLRAAHGAKKKR